MKRCPTCQRTYASDEFTFCLDDGALLSAPYELQQGERSSGRSGPPPTEVLPVAPTPTVPSAPRESKSPAMTTIAAPPPAAIAAPRGTTVTAPARVSRGTSWKIVFILGPLVLIAGLVGGTLYLLASTMSADNHLLLSGRQSGSLRGWWDLAMAQGAGQPKLDLAGIVGNDHEN